MPKITLPDGAQRDFSEPMPAYKVIESIGSRLAKDALAVRVDGQLKDTTTIIDRDVTFQVITAKDQEGLEIIRHSSAHLLAQAVKRQFPSAQVTIGPVIEDGFYYDIAYERPFTPEDLAQIEDEMRRIVKEDLRVTRQELSRDEAIAFFQKMGEHYKVEIIQDIPNGECLTAYQQGDFIDLCRGPHVPRTGLLKAFKLTKLAGAYWRGDSSREMLSRIYGTAWATVEDLNAYLHRIEEAEKRDHRLLGKKMDLFHFQSEAPGSIFWHPNGWTIVNVIRDKIRRVIGEKGYEEVNTPQLVESTLWELSGHKAKFSDDMFSAFLDEREYVIKPMNCPCHVQIFKQGIKSYRDLPIRYAEFGSCHRNEPSGTLHGLMRLRAFVQDDAHIFCTEDQIQAEVSAFISQLHQLYRDFGFPEVQHKLSTRPEKRVGSEELWDKAEAALKSALDHQQVSWQLQPGEGAFYGPKIEFSLQDCLGRVWQCGTIQIDFSTADRLGAVYITEDGSKRPPVMVHRAMLGSIERFLGVLLEHYAGWLPLWLAPQQVVAMNITDRQADYVQNLVIELKKNGIRAKSDLRNEKIGFKIREHTIARVPYQLVIGDRELEHGEVSVREKDSSKSESMSVEAFINKLKGELQQQ